MNEIARLSRRSRNALLATVLAGAFLLPAGCQVLGFAANAMPQPKVKAKSVLAGNAVGVMVWCDRGLRVDWPTLQRDLGGGVMERLAEAQKAKAKEMENVTFPFPAESYVRWQHDHPGYEAEPITTIAANLHVTRLIYIEVDDLSTRTSKEMALYRGTAQASIKVIDVPAGATAGKVVYDESDIHVIYPKHSTEEGRAEGNDARMYAGTVTQLADQLAMRFVEHEAEDEK